jgi:hypothetical protein
MARKKQIKEEGPKKLTEVEGLKLDLLNAEERVRELELKLQVAQRLLLEKEIVIHDLEKFKAQTELRHVGEEIVKTKEKINVVKDQRKELLKGVASRLGIEGAWGYDPDTLEVAQ